MRSFTLSSPAKINLYLRILNRRPDGYHNLVTLFHRISLADQITLQKIPSGFFLRCSNPSLPVDETNLITRGYRLLQKKFPYLGGVKVQLIKKIPVGAGLGGGSGNAATFLLGMKKMFGLKISQKELLKMGGMLGSDVPFFLLNTQQAIGLGRGEKLRKLPSKRVLWFLLILSNKGLRTKDVYETLPRNLAPASLTKAEAAVKLLCNLLQEKKIRQIQDHLKNDLESPAFQLRPSLGKRIAGLRSKGIVAQMSGSGPTVFAVLTSQKEARRLAQRLRIKKSERIFVCHTQ